MKGISTCSFLESVELREGSVKATVKLKVLQELFLYFQRFPDIEASSRNLSGPLAVSQACSLS